MLEENNQLQGGNSKHTLCQIASTYPLSLIIFPCFIPSLWLSMRKSE